jgi:hypothetical protein
LSNILGRAALNEFTYGFSMNRITNTPNPEATRPSALRIAEIFPLNRQNVIPNVTITGYGAIGVGTQLNNANPVFTFRDDYSILVGRHSLKMGAEVIRTQKFSTSYDNMQGSFSFNGSRSGNAFADFLLGEAFNYTENEIEEKGTSSPPTTSSTPRTTGRRGATFRSTTVCATTSWKAGTAAPRNMTASRLSFREFTILPRLPA